MNDRADLESLREETRAEFAGVHENLRKDHPKVASRAAAVVGGTLGGAAFLTANVFGTVNGFASTRAIGVAARSVARGVPGWQAAAAAVALAAAAAVVGYLGYLIGRRRNAKLAASLRTAIEELHRILERLTTNAEYFREEIAGFKAYIDYLESQIHGD